MQNNAVKTNYVKPKINNTQQDSKCRLCDDKDEMINCINKQIQQTSSKKYKTRHDSMGKVIH